MVMSISFFYTHECGKKTSQTCAYIFIIVFQEIKKRREEELAALSVKLESLNDGVESMELDMQKFSTNMGKVCTWKYAHSHLC